MNNIVIIGSTGAIGAAFTRYYAGLESSSAIYALSRSGVPAGDARVTAIPMDITDESSVAQAAAALEATPLHAVILATGVLHDNASLQPEKSLRDIDADNFARVFSINTIGPALVMKHFLPLLDRNKRALFSALSARVGSISDNRLGGWYAYRASKAALNMLIRTAAVEMKRRNPQAIILGLHPGTVDSALSQPFQRRVADGKLFTADVAVARMAAVLETAGPDDSGKCLAWDGREITP